MQTRRFSTGRLLVLVLASLTIAFGYSAVSTAIEFPAPAGEAAATPAAAEPAAPATEIDQARVLAGLTVFKDAGCRGCHGWAANGEREGPNPEGPSLRATLLDYDAIRLTVACGRPGTVMPYFWRDAYRRDSTECYGTTGAAFGDLLPNRASVRLSAEDLDNIAYYIENYVKGRGDITFEECEFYFGVGNAQCNFYR